MMRGRRPSHRPAIRYRPPVNYTAEQLYKAEIADLETDIRCAERDNMPEYAEQCRRKLALLRMKAD